MRAVFEVITPAAQESFACRAHASRSFSYPWHFHPEVELTLIVESAGRRFVGDHIADFEAGDLVLLGANLPHFWYNDEQDGHRRAKSVVVQFREDFLGREFLQRPELRVVRRLLENARRGLEVTGRSREDVSPRLLVLPGLRGLARVTALLTILETLAASRSLRPLASPGFVPSPDRQDEERIGKVCRWINQRFTGPLYQPEAARLAHMTPPAFSRYFRRKTGRTFTEFVNELRVGHASKLLIEGRLNVTEVCFASGFENLSNFQRRFRRLKECSPREFQEKFEHRE